MTFRLYIINLVQNVGKLLGGFLPEPPILKEGDVATGPDRPTIQFDACLASTFSEEIITDFRSPVTKEIGEAIQRDRIASFPEYLIVQLKVSRSYLLAVMTLVFSS